jgi:hypothetical protein
MDGHVRPGRWRLRRAVAAAALLVAIAAPVLGAAAPAAASAVVPFGAASSFQWNNGVTATILSAHRFQPSATADGARSGETVVRIVVRISNGSTGPLDVGATVVNVKAGFDGVQADSVFDPVNGIDIGLEGVIAPGRAATAEYGFGVPPADLGRIDVEVSPDYDYDSAIFEGSVR